jgi:hypothetical protein
MMEELRYVKRKDLDTGKWNNCITNSSNVIIYALSFYLDALAENWDALVLRDYEAVMPLPWKKKWGIKYLYQPAFVQQTGIFFTTACNKSAFITKAKKYFLFAEIFMGQQKNISSTSLHNNFFLHLRNSYQQIICNYKNDLKKNIRHSKKFNLVYKNTKNYKEIIEVFSNQYKKKLHSLTKKDYINFEQLCNLLEQQQMLLCRTVYDENGLLAGCITFLFKNRLYLIMCVTLPAGRKKEATHFLIDRIIHEFSGCDIVLDFEGSDVPGIAHFYQNFGSINEPYIFVKWNKLPWPVKLLKK